MKIFFQMVLQYEPCKVWGKRKNHVIFSICHINLIKGVGAMLDQKYKFSLIVDSEGNDLITRKLTLEQLIYLIVSTLWKYIKPGLPGFIILIKLGFLFVNLMN